MKVIALIDRPAIIQQILEHLGLSTAAPSFRAHEPLLDDLPVPDPLIV